VVFLGDCPIVATNREDDAGQFGAQFGADLPAGGDGGTAGTPGDWERYPVLWRPAPPKPAAVVPPPPKNFLVRLMETLASIPEEEEPDEYEVVRPVSSFGFPWKELPTRACVRCGTPLPDEIGDRQILKIGIVGTTGAGKSHFLAALIKEAAHQQGLRKWGIAEFELVETSSEMYRERYESFWHDRRVLEPNLPADAPEVVFRPLIVRATYLRGTKVLLYFYDIDGESLANRGRRARYASYLRRPHGLIFLIDPMMIDAIRTHLAPGESGYHRYIRQGDLVNACVADLEADRARRTPIAIALSKSDLVATAAGRQHSFTFSRPATASDPIDSVAAEMAHIHREVREVLGAAGERDLLAVADRLGPGAPLTFHAVAPIGYAPQHEDGVRVAPEIKPLRCLDPLIALISPWVRDQIRSGL
jgi:hypothetical protein